VTGNFGSDIERLAFEQGEIVGRAHAKPSEATLHMISDIRELIRAHTVDEEKRFAEINTKLDMMYPIYTDLSEWETFLKMAKKLGIGMVAVVTFLGVLYGAAEAIKQWVARNQ